MSICLFYHPKWDVKNSEWIILHVGQEENFYGVQCALSMRAIFEVMRFMMRSGWLKIFQSQIQFYCLQFIFTNQRCAGARVYNCMWRTCRRMVGMNTAMWLKFSCWNGCSSVFGLQFLFRLDVQERVLDLCLLPRSCRVFERQCLCENEIDYWTSFLNALYARSCMGRSVIFRA